MNRRGFFKSIFSNADKVVNIKKIANHDQAVIIRPPYSHDNELFQQQCCQCDGKCSTACEQGIIEIGKDSTPYINFKNKGCTFCEKCAQACDKNVLKVDSEREYINAQAYLDKITCLSWNKNICRSCLDVCETRAIKFVGGLWMANVDANLCTGCGLCVSVCPNKSLTMTYKEG